MSRNVTRISVKVEHGRISKAMNKFKSKVTNEEIIKTVKDNRYYMKPSLKKALKRKKAEAQRRKDEINLINKIIAEEEQWRQMSYYRWSNSNWYAFWMSSEADRKEDEQLALWYNMETQPTFSYQDLEGIVDLETTKSFLYRNFKEEYSNFERRDFHEAFIAIQEFREDVNNGKSYKS